MSKAIIKTIVIDDEPDIREVLIETINESLEMEVIGQTRDDAAGEAFDKSGKMMGLDYPAGPIIDKLARQGKPRFEFPEPQIKGLDFSFSGLKTAILYFLRDQVKENPHFIEENLNDICASVQERIVTILLRKLKKAVKVTGIREIAISGGAWYIFAEAGFNPFGVGRQKSIPVADMFWVN